MRVFIQLQTPADAETTVAAAEAGFTPAGEKGNTEWA